MFVRRMVTYFRGQNWTPKEFTAVGVDLVIVVLGVFIATQVADWSAREADKRRGQTYMQQLTAAIEADQIGRQRILGYYEAVYEGAVRTNELLGQTSPDPRELVINAYRATEYIYGTTTVSTWNQIVSSGDIDLLPFEVRRPMEFYIAIDSALEVRETFNNSAYRQITRRLITFKVQDAMRARCSDQTDASGAIIGFPAACDLSDVDDSEILASARALQREPRVLMDLRYQISDLSAARANILRDIVRGDRALDALRAAQ